MNITIFGGSHPQPGSPAYLEAYELGSLLAQAGHAVLTGGYIGTMEAISRGAAEAGGHVIGVTCGDIEAWRPVKPNAWVKEERRFQTLEQRLTELVHACDAAIALPGGPGTLTEIALTWNLMIISAIPPKPLILVGYEWQSTFALFLSKFEDHVTKNQIDLLIFASSIQTAIHLLGRKNG